nr:hypothetical protein CFP56_35567 [Quercus suber]
MASNEQLTLDGLNPRIEHLESQHDRLLHFMHQLYDLHIDTLANDMTCGVDVLDAYASHRIPGHVNESSSIEKRARESQRPPYDSISSGSTLSFTVTKQRQSKKRHFSIEWHKCLGHFVNSIIHATANTIEGEVSRIDGT